MHWTKFYFITGPAILATLLLANLPANASNAVNLHSVERSQQMATDHAVAVTLTKQSNRPLIPTGCGCARCTKTEELLQGRFPLF